MQFVAAPPEQLLQVAWQVVQTVSVLGFTRKLPSGHAAVHVLEIDQKYLKLITPVLHVRQSVLVPAEQVRHSLLHFEQSLLTELDSKDPEGQLDVHVLATE